MSGRCWWDSTRPGLDRSHGTRRRRRTRGQSRTELNRCGTERVTRSSLRATGGGRRGGHVRPHDYDAATAVGARATLANPYKGTSWAKRTWSRAGGRFGGAGESGAPEGDPRVICPALGDPRAPTDRPRLGVLRAEERAVRNHIYSLRLRKGIALVVCRRLHSEIRRQLPQKMGARYAPMRWGIAFR